MKTMKSGGEGKELTLVVVEMKGWGSRTTMENDRKLKNEKYKPRGCTTQ
jgi:hypothetical protein